MDLLKEMHGLLNKRSVEAGGKEQSFNGFMEDIVERFLISDYGQRLCTTVDRFRDKIVNDRNEKQKEASKKWEDY